MKTKVVIFKSFKTIARFYVATFVSLGAIAVPSLGVSAPAPAPPAGDPADTDQLKKLYSGANCSNPMSDRFIGTVNSTDPSINTFTFSYYGAKYSEVKVSETSRPTLFVSGLETLLKSATGLAAGGASTCTNTTYKLQDNRATLTLTPVPLKAGDTDVVQSQKVLTGPPEHWYIGLDLPVNNSKTLKYDSTSHSLQPQSTNPQLYVSANIQIGDTASDPGDLKPYENVAFKAMFLATSRPLDSIGLAIGYRLPSWAPLGVQLDALSIFGGYFWTKQDTVVGGAPQSNGATATGWRFGVTFDVNAAVKWVKW